VGGWVGGREGIRDLIEGEKKRTLYPRERQWADVGKSWRALVIKRRAREALVGVRIRTLFLS
jgi:hypothetical protein